MPHTTTKSMRSKRPDTRPNAKQRQKIQQRLEKDRQVQELRTVRKQAGEKKTRECQTLQPLRKVDKKGETEKYIGSLKKKLRAIGINIYFIHHSFLSTNSCNHSFYISDLLRYIDDLLSKQKEGVELDEQQIEKIEKLPQIMEALQDAMKEATNVDLDIV